LTNKKTNKKVKGPIPPYDQPRLEAEIAATEAESQGNAAEDFLENLKAEVAAARG